MLHNDYERITINKIFFVVYSIVRPYERRSRNTASLCSWHYYYFHDNASLILSLISSLRLLINFVRVTFVDADLELKSAR